MHNEITIQKFIDLRALGNSYAKIYQELGVPISTLIKWGQRYNLQVQHQRAVQVEAIHHQCFVQSQEKWERLAGQLQQVERELAVRGLGDIPTARLFSIAAKLRAEINLEQDKLVFPESAGQSQCDPSEPPDRSSENPENPKN